jgi:hypothetical protein
VVYISILKKPLELNDHHQLIVVDLGVESSSLCLCQCHLTQL